MFDFGDLTVGQQFTYAGEEWVKVATVSGTLALAVRKNDAAKCPLVHLVEAPKFDAASLITKEVQP